MALLSTESVDVHVYVRVAGEGFVRLCSGTICDDLWDINDARVVCTQLGFYGTAVATGGGEFGPGSFDMPIWLDSVQCSGIETDLGECRSDGWGNHDCFHFKDAGVICESMIALCMLCNNL